ncbi:unnamed protein product [Clonostachys byssicola]|uniref:Heterokaryon incompatibility domain-containing protein n=1 Tax=Clonostachys byssicola TaxID=160290 RepID=A0A9N9U420_9HYPO|nr:unnamed protein product [Clonostachys byssicola]
MASHHTPIQPYSGPPLPTQNHIRLISLTAGIDNSIVCEFKTVEIDTAPVYEALSYTWGDPSNRKTIAIKDPGESAGSKDVSITANCFSAFRCLLKSKPPRLLWVDDLCIDQSNTVERDHQVSLMSRIYSKAAQVVIYLGEAADNSDLAVEFIKECDNPSPETTSLSYPKTKTLVESLCNFFRRPWFTRVWVIQEAMLSRSGTVYCGDQILSWSAVRHFNEWDQSNKWLKTLPYVMSVSQTSLEKSDIRVSLLIALVETRHCGATDPRDKIYSLLPLFHSVKEQLDLAPKYGDSVAKVYTDCATALLSRQSCGVLNAVQSGSKIEGLPSWVPDWSMPPKRTVLGPIEYDPKYYGSEPFSFNKPENPSSSPRLVAKQAPNGNTGARGAVLRVDGGLCGEVAQMGSVYLAGQGPFPYFEWKALLNDEAITRIDRRSERSWDGHKKVLESEFYNVIAANRNRTGYEEAIRRFVQKEKNLQNEAVGASTAQTANGGASKPSWESAVRGLMAEASRRGSLEDGLLPFRDIPFHEVATEMVPSYKYYVQAVLRNSHSRRFFITTTGYMGLAPAEAKLGDQVYMVVGTVTPLLLRPVSDGVGDDKLKQFQLVGASFMESKARKDLADRPSTLEHIEIV